jgi:hypothetical protein
MGLLTIIAATAAEEEHSEAPFIIAGIVLALFAVLISALGFTRPQFPGSESGARGVIGLGAVLVLLTLTMVIVISS